MSVTDTITDTITSTAQAVQEWSLSALRTSDEALADAARNVAGTFSPVAERLGSQVPPVRPLVENWFGFAEKVLAEQKRFGMDLLDSFGRPAPVRSTGTRRQSSKKAA